jgi:hypothetical protein
VQIGATGSTAITLHLLPNGETQMSSNDPWYRLFRALADLYLAGEIDIDELADQSTHWLGSGPRIDRLREMYPAAASLEGKIALTWMEPCCPHDPHVGCECPPLTDDDWRARLRDLIGA